MNSQPTIKMEKMDSSDETDNLPLLDFIKEENIHEVNFDASTSQASLGARKRKLQDDDDYDPFADETSCFSTCTDEQEMEHFFVLHIKCESEMKIVEIEKESLNRKNILTKISQAFPCTVDYGTIKTNLGAQLSAKNFLTVVKQLMNSASFYLEVSKGLMRSCGKKSKCGASSSTCGKSKAAHSGTSTNKGDTLKYSFVRKKSAANLEEFLSSMIDAPVTSCQVKEGGTSISTNKGETRGENLARTKSAADLVDFLMSMIESPATSFKVKEGSTGITTHKGETRKEPIMRKSAADLNEFLSSLNAARVTSSTVKEGKTTNNDETRGESVLRIKSAADLAVSISSMNDGPVTSCKLKEGDSVTSTNKGETRGESIMRKSAADLSEFLRSLNDFRATMREVKEGGPCTSTNECESRRESLLCSKSTDDLMELSSPMNHATVTSYGAKGGGTDTSTNKGGTHGESLERTKSSANLAQFLSSIIDATATTSNVKEEGSNTATNNNETPEESVVRARSTADLMEVVVPMTDTTVAACKIKEEANETFTNGDDACAKSLMIPAEERPACLSPTNDAPPATTCSTQDESYEKHTNVAQTNVKPFVSIELNEDSVELMPPSVIAPSISYTMQEEGFETCKNRNGNSNRADCVEIVELDDDDDSVELLSPINDAPSSSRKTGTADSDASAGHKRAKPFAKKILFNEPFFCDIKKTAPTDAYNDGIVVTCATCRKSIRGNFRVTSNFIRHLKKQHPEIYTMYQEGLQKQRIDSVTDCSHCHCNKKLH